MSWETRSNGKRYYTRSSRVNGRIRREYVGGGQLGEFVAKLDELDRESRLLEAESIRQARQEATRIDESLADFETLAESVGRAMLIAAGYHQHNRGEWRKRNE
jgi:hypothetical protein